MQAQKLFWFSLGPARYVNQFWVFLKKYEPAKYILGTLEGQGVTETPKLVYIFFSYVHGPWIKILTKIRALGIIKFLMKPHNYSLCLELLPQS